MDGREIGAGAVLVALGLGGAAMTQVAPAVFPGHERLIFWLGLALVVLAVLGLVVLFATSRKKPAPPSPRSTTARASGGGHIELEDSYSTADTFADAEEGSSIAAKRFVHDPAGGGGHPRSDPAANSDDPKLPNR